MQKLVTPNLLLSVHGLACARGDRILFTDLSFDLPAGGALIVSGANGTGKTSLLRILAGLLRPVAGNVSGTAPRALVDERVALDTVRPLGECLDFWARRDGVASSVLTRAIAAMDLAPLVRVPVGYLSTGQRRRAALARVIASARPLWLLDEPLSGLDTASISAVEQAIATHRIAGGGCIVATHQPIMLTEASQLVLPGAAARP